MPDSGSPIAVRGIGIHSSLGGMAQASAAFRAGMSRARALKDWHYLDEELLHEHVLAGHPAAGLQDGFGGVARILKLAVAGLADLQRDLGDRAFHADKIAFCLVLPDDVFEAEETPSEPALARARLRKLSPLPITETNLEVFRGGKAGSIYALQRARDILQSKYRDACVVGAVDSLIDGPRLLPLIRAGKVKTVDNPIGPMPGEGACFVLLERAQGAAARGHDVLVHHPYLSVPDPQAPPADPANPDAQAAAKELGLVLQAALNEIPAPAQPGVMYSDLDGDPIKAADLANALLSSPDLRPLMDWKHEIPALGFGSTGAVAPLLALCLRAAAARRRGSGPPTDGLVVTTDPQSRAAFVTSEVRYG